MPLSSSSAESYLPLRLCSDRSTARPRDSDKHRPLRNKRNPVCRTDLRPWPVKSSASADRQLCQRPRRPGSLRQRNTRDPQQPRGSRRRARSALAQTAEPASVYKKGGACPSAASARTNCTGFSNAATTSCAAGPALARPAMSRWPWPRSCDVEVRPVCVNASRFDCTLEPTGREDRFAVRLGLRMVRGLATGNAVTLITTRADEPFASIDDLWRRAGVPVTALIQLAEADAFRSSLKLARREALWAIKALRDEPLPLFAVAAARAAKTVLELREPAVALRPMTAGGEVVEDYGHVGLTLRSHPLSFLRSDLSRQRMVTCAEAMRARDGRWLETAGLVLVRQMPLSAKGIMFLTIKDETGIANLVIWPKLFERQRRVVLSAKMMAVHGRIQPEGDVVHLAAHRVTDLSDLLASVEHRDAIFPAPHGRGDELRHGSSATIKLKAREFREG